MQINGSNINDYLKRFFDGETTCAEETELCRYFREEKRLPEGLEQYRRMFAWIEAGMTETGLESSKKRPTVLKKSVIWWSAAVAACIVAVVVTTFSVGSDDDPSLLSRNEIYYGSYVETQVGKNTDISAIMPEIESTLKEVEEMERELANLNFDNPAFMM